MCTIARNNNSIFTHKRHKRMFYLFKKSPGTVSSRNIFLNCENLRLTLTICRLGTRTNRKKTEIVLIVSPQYVLQQPCKYNRCPTSTALMRELTLLWLCVGSLYIKFALILLFRWSRAKTTRICSHKRRQQLNSRLSFPKLASPRGRQRNLGRLLQHLQRSKR